MGLPRALHAFAIFAMAGCGSADAQPRPKPQNPPQPGTGAIKPAGSSEVESSDVPTFQASPARFAVTPFVNHSNVRAMDWLVVGAPFEIAEKTEDVLGLEPT